MDSRPLRLVQIFVAMAIIGDMVALVVRGASDAVLFPRSLGGISSEPGNWLLVEWGAYTGPALWALVVVSLLFVILGVATRPALVVALISYAEFGHMYTPGDRGIDRILRTAMLILVFSAVSEAKWGEKVASWPSDLIRWLLVMVYLDAGWAKYKRASGWLEMQPFPELYEVMAAPNIGRWDPVMMAEYPWIFVAGGWYTFALEASALLLLTRFAPYWAVFGVFMHLGIAATMELGMFPFGMLALYPVLFAPWIAKWRPRSVPAEALRTPV